jgi:hypothetical protein
MGQKGGWREENPCKIFVVETEWFAYSLQNAACYQLHHVALLPTVVFNCYNIYPVTNCSLIPLKSLPAITDSKMCCPAINAVF